MAEMLLNSWNEKLSMLPDSIIILPTHYKNLFCSKKGKYEPCSTIGKEKKINLYLQFHDNKSLFLNKVLCGLKPVSGFNKKVALINQRGPDLVNWDNPFKEQISSLKDFYKDHNFWLFDLNKFKIYKRSHSNGALNISVKDNFESWFPKILGLHSKIVLYGSDELADQIARRLKILGIYSYKLDANFEFKSQPRTLEYIEPDVFYKDYIAKKAAPVLNIYLEDQKVKIETELVINKSVSELDDFLTSKFNTDQKFVLLAGSETSLRLSTAVMERSGFNNFQVFAGGTLAWVEAGLPIMKKNSDFSSSDSAKKAADIKFPLILSIEQLVEDFPEKLIKYSVIDIRSSELAEKYNPLNARRVEVSNLLAEPEKFSAGKPMLIVDSNGTLAFFVAALIAKDSPKQVFVLKDGLQAFWRENIKNKFKFNNPG
jgi:rhodanese-related sulfurtransferase